MPLPKYRTHLYQEFRACERFGMIPPGVKRRWDDNTPAVQVVMLAYNDIRRQEEVDEIVPPIVL